VVIILLAGSFAVYDAHTSSGFFPEPHSTIQDEIFAITIGNGMIYLILVYEYAVVTLYLRNNGCQKITTDPLGWNLIIYRAIRISKLSTAEKLKHKWCI
jgi:hypothetical protein